MFTLNNKKIAIIFICLISIQILFSFLSPAYDSTSYWQTVQEMGFSSWNQQRYSFDAFDNSLMQKIYPLIANYRMNLDAGGYLLVAHDFPQHYFKGNLTLLIRPLYPILVSWLAMPLHLISSSYSMTFAAGLLLNFILFFLTIYLFYWLVKKHISFRVAFLSSVLLIFSPFAHIWLIQPETNIFSIFAIIFTLFLLDNYLAAPSLRKLIIFSLLVGIFLLGKLIFAISIFILLLAFFFKRYKEGIIFFVLHLLPLAFWAFWVTQIWHLPFYVSDISEWGCGIWFFNIFSWPWHQTFQIFLNSVPNFISMVIYGFILLPMIFALVGYKRLVFPKKNIFLFSFIFSFFILILGMQIFWPRYGFWLFPVILPLAVLGINEAAGLIKKYKASLVPVFYILIYSLIISISFLNIYKVFYYG